MMRLPVRWRWRRFRPAALSVALLLLSESAFGSLGGDVSSIELDRTELKGVGGVMEARDYTMHELRLPGGGLVREYVSAAGVVFAVAWRGPFRPNLQQLLGTYFEGFQRASQAAKATHVGRGPLRIETPTLVVHMGGHPRAFFGRAYLPSAIPPDVPVADIR